MRFTAYSPLVHLLSRHQRMKINNNLRKIKTFQTEHMRVDTLDVLIIRSVFF